MVNPFDNSRMASGYARWRPRVHPHFIDRIRARAGRMFEHALDAGCGAGISTVALEPVALRRTGIEPSHAMLRQAAGADFAVARSEAIPFSSGTFDLLTAAGSLNWTDLDLFFSEARRVVRRGGWVVVYDFSQGLIGGWEQEFHRKYPSPPCGEVSMSSLNFAARGLTLEHYEGVRVTFPMSEDFYLEYAMTETNVHDAIARGVGENEIRSWCARTLREVFDGGPRDVSFEGFIAYARS